MECLEIRFEFSERHGITVKRNSAVRTDENLRIHRFRRPGISVRRREFFPLGGNETEQLTFGHLAAVECHRTVRRNTNDSRHIVRNRGLAGRKTAQAKQPAHERESGEPPSGEPPPFVTCHHKKPFFSE